MARGGAAHPAHARAAILKEIADMTLTINFHGICVFFNNVLPGIAHRVVLPNALQVQFGVVNVATQPPAAYYLLPHYAFLRSQTTSDVAGEHVDVLDGVHLQLLNPAKSQPLQVAEWLPSFSLRNYVSPTSTYSEEVVLGGRAAAYFDFNGGQVRINQTPRGAVYTTVTIETDGPPLLRLLRFPGTPGVRSEVRTINDPILTIGNMDFDASDEDDNFDFLLNYLVTRDGIPQFLDQPVPGMPDNPQSATAAQIESALQRLAARIGAGLGDGQWVTKQQIIEASLDVLTASCSNSAWP